MHLSHGRARAFADRPRPESGPLRILIMTTSFPLRRHDVSGVFVERLAHSLATRNEVEVLTPDDWRDDQDEDGRPYAVRRARYAPRRWQRLAHVPGGIPAALESRWSARMLVAPLMASMMWGCCRGARRADVIFANWSVNGVLAGIAGRLLGVPVVTTLRGEDANRAAGAPIYRAMLRTCMRLSSRVVTVSPAIADQLVDAGLTTRDRVTTIANGVGDEFLAVSRDARQSPGLRLAFVGSLVPNKGVDLILTALAGCPADTTLTVVGAGSEGARLIALANATGLADRVRFLGPQPHVTMPGILSEHDALVLASRREGRPNVVLEALASGMPVVASNIPGVAGLVCDGENGALFPPGDADALREQLLRLREPTLRRRLGESGRAGILAAGLTWGACAAAYENVFRHAIARARPCAD